MNGTMTKPASVKQLKWLRDLLNTKDYSAFPADWVKVCDLMRARMNKLVDDGYEAGAIQVELELEGKPQITHEDFQKLLPKLQAAQTVAVKSEKLGVTWATEDGVYLRDNTIFKLKQSQTGKQWAHKLHIVENQPDKGGHVAATFRYFGTAATAKITAEHKLTYDKAKEFGALYGVCCCCGRLLTNELSIALGIGPVCGQREFGGEFKLMINQAKADIIAG